MALKITNREQLIEMARDRGQRWGVYKFRESTAGLPRNNFPPMTDQLVATEAYQRVADILPIDEFGESLVRECYEAARDAYKAEVKQWKATTDALSSTRIDPVLKR